MGMMNLDCTSQHTLFNGNFQIYIDYQRSPRKSQRLLMPNQQCQSTEGKYVNLAKTRMWANAQLDGRPAEHWWRPLFNAPKFG